MNMPKLHNLSSSSIKTLRTISKPAVDPPILETQLQRCRSLNQFNQILSQNITSGSLRDTFTSGELLKLSAAAPFVPADYSLHILTHLESSDGFHWNTLMRSQIRRFSPNKVMGIYKLMLEKGVRPDRCTHPVLVQACALRGSEIDGAAAHGHALKLGFDSELYVRNNLILMYSVCGSAGNARKVFDESPVRDLVSWNTLLVGYARDRDVDSARWVFENMPQKDSFAYSMIALLGDTGRVDEALRVFMNVSEKDIFTWSSLISCYRQNAMFREALLVFVDMIDNGVLPDEVVLIKAISICVELPCLKTGKLVHGLVVKSGNEAYVNLKNTLIHMYSSCGDISGAETLFSLRNEFLNHVSWNTMMTGYLRSGFVDDAKEVFEAMPEKNAVTWNVMVSGFAQNGRFPETLTLFLEMLRGGVRFNETTLVSVVSACTHLALLKQGRSVQALTWKNGIRGTFLGTALIDMYMKCGCAEDGVRIFSEMEETDVSSWNALILGLAMNGMANESLAMFSEMKKTGPLPDEITYIAVLGACRHMGLVDLKTGKLVHGLVVKSGNEAYVNLKNALIHMYSSCGDISGAETLFSLRNEFLNHVSWNSMMTGYLRSGFIDDAKEVFEAMPEKNTVTWNVMVSGFAQNGRFPETLTLFLEMSRGGVRFDEITLMSVVSACTHLALLEQGRSVQALTWKNGIRVVPFLGTALIDMYMKCGCAEDGVRIFSEMEETDVSSWNALILGLATNGMANESLAMFSEMKKNGPVPDEITYMAVLGACRHMGLVDQGRSHFVQLTRERNLEPNVKHYGCMVDLLGRAGLLGEAEELVRAMPMAPDAATWGALLGACRMHDDTERGERIGRELVQLQPDNVDFHVVLSDIYASKGDWDDVVEIRETMSRRGMVRTPARSMIGANGTVP